MLRNTQRIDQLCHIASAVAANESSYVTAYLALLIICLKEKSLDSLSLIQSQKFSYVFDRLCSRSIHLFHRKHLLIRRSIIPARRALHCCRHVTLCAVSDLALTIF